MRGHSCSCGNPKDTQSSGGVFDAVGEYNLILDSAVVSVFSAAAVYHVETQIKLNIKILNNFVLEMVLQCFN
jgi:hypothetical protein